MTITQSQSSIQQIRFLEYAATRRRPESLDPETRPGSEKQPVAHSVSKSPRAHKRFAGRLEPHFEVFVRTSDQPIARPRANHSASMTEPSQAASRGRVSLSTSRSSTSQGLKLESRTYRGDRRPQVSAFALHLTSRSHSLSPTAARCQMPAPVPEPHHEGRRGPSNVRRSNPPHAREDAR